MFTQKDTQPSQTCSGGVNKRSFKLLVAVSLQFGSIIKSNLMLADAGSYVYSSIRKRRWYGALRIM
jgi:hypothetical protein